MSASPVPRWVDHLLALPPAKAQRDRLLRERLTLLREALEEGLTPEQALERSDQQQRARHQVPPRRTS